MNFRGFALRWFLMLGIVAGLSACSSRAPEPVRAPSGGAFSLLEPLHRSTGVQLAALSQAPGLCRALLWEAREPFRELADQRTGPYCGFFDTVEVSGNPIAYTRDAKVTCPLAAALVVWQREIVVPAARRHFGSEIDSINHFGTYSCRTRNGRAGAKPSEHATANAIDVAGFRLRNGRKISVLQGWNGRPDERAFLREVHQGGCQVFRLVLGPDADAAHANHFHFDMGRWVRCQ